MLRIYSFGGTFLAAAIAVVTANPALAAHNSGNQGGHKEGGASHGNAAKSDRGGQGHDAHGDRGGHGSGDGAHAREVKGGGGGGGGGGGHGGGGFGGGGFGGGGHGGGGFGGGGFGGGGMSHSFSGGGGGMSHSFSGGGGTSRSFNGGNFNGGNSHNFSVSPQSNSHNFSNNSWNGSHSRDFSTESWAHNQPHGQSTWQRERSSSTWQFERSQSSWQQHLSDWKNGENWHNGNWNNGNWNHGNWNNSWWGHNNWSSANWWGRNNWWGHSNWWNHSGFCYYPVIGFGAAFWFPWWSDAYFPSYDYYCSNDYVTPYYLNSSLYAPATALVSQPEVAQAQYVDPLPTAQSSTNQPAGESDAGAEYFAQASAAFRSAQYKESLRLANHAAVESPQNPKAHEVMSLSLFASGDYRGAAAEAHAALAFGPPADWATLYTYYGDDALYTTQLRSLEKYSHENPTSADARFVRAYQYLMMGHQQQAIDQLQEVAKLTPTDRLVSDLLKKFSESPTGAAPTPPTQAPVPAKPIPPQGGLRPVDNGGVDS